MPWLQIFIVAASHSGSPASCMGRNLNGTFMIKRRAERRSDGGMDFLCTRGGNQVGIRRAQDSLTNAATQGQAFSYHLKRQLERIDIVNSVSKRGEGPWGCEPD